MLLGITGSGKTFTMAQVVEKIQRPTLVIAHNKTLAHQLWMEFRSLFPDNAIHYFVSYYDYYQPEAYVPSTDTYIEKDSLINEEIDRMRHAATYALLTRRDSMIVASVSCIYGIGAAEAYLGMKLDLAQRRRGAARRRAAPAGRDPVRAQRRRLRARHVPRARRHRRDLPRLRAREGDPRSSGSATRSRRSPRSIRCAARCCARSTRCRSSRARTT